jgi:hypothetical protein
MALDKKVGVVIPVNGCVSKSSYFVEERYKSKNGLEMQMMGPKLCLDDRLRNYLFAMDDALWEVPIP